MQRNAIICNFKVLTWRTKLAERRFSPFDRRRRTQVAHVAMIVPQLFRTPHTSCWFHCFQFFQESLNIEEKCHQERQRMNKMLQNKQSETDFYLSCKTPQNFQQYTTGTPPLVTSIGYSAVQFFSQCYDTNCNYSLHIISSTFEYFFSTSQFYVFYGDLK